MKKTTGIWIDLRQADIIHLCEGELEFATLKSAIEVYHPKGGSRSKVPYGPMDKMNEKAYLERKNHQKKAYYKQVIDAVNESDEVYIFGPAEAKDELVKEIKSFRGFKPSLRKVEKADSMTRNQKIAQVKAVFSES